MVVIRLAVLVRVGRIETKQMVFERVPLDGVRHQRMPISGQ